MPELGITELELNAATAVYTDSELRDENEEVCTAAESAETYHVKWMNMFCL